MSDASVTLGLNAAELYSELNAAVSRFQQQTKRMEQSAGGAAGGIDRLTAGHERLFTSSHRVASRIGALTQTLVSGGSAADAMGVAIEGLGRSLNLPLGILAALAAVGVLTQQIYKSQSEITRLNKEIDQLNAAGHISPRFEALETIKTRADEAKKKLEELQKAHNGFIQQVLRFEGISAEDFGKKTPKEAKEQYRERQRGLRQDQKRAEEGEAEKETQNVEIAQTKFNRGDLAAKDKEIEQKKHEKLTAIGATYESDVKDDKGNTTHKQGDFVIRSKKARDEQTSDVNRQAAVDHAEVQFKRDALQREVAEEKELTAIKASGINVDERSAEVKLKYAKAALDAAKSEPEEVQKATAAVHAAAAEIEVIVRSREKAARVAGEETEELQAQLAGYDELAGILKEEAAVHERILEAMKNGDNVLANQLEKQRAIKNDIAKQKAEGGKTQEEKNKTKRNENRDIRHENQRERELKNELSRTGDPNKRADIQDELGDIQSKREERAQKHAQEQAAAEAAAQKAAQDQAAEQATTNAKQNAPLPGGPVAGVGESQAKVNEIEANRRAAEGTPVEPALGKGPIRPGVASTDPNVTLADQPSGFSTDPNRKLFTPDESHFSTGKNRQKQASSALDDTSVTGLAASSDGLRKAGDELKEAAVELKKAVTNQ